MIDLFIAIVIFFRVHHLGMDRRRADEFPAPVALLGGLDVIHPERRHFQFRGVGMSTGHHHAVPLRRRNSRRHIGRCLPDRMGAQPISSSSRVFPDTRWVLPTGFGWLGAFFGRRSGVMAFNFFRKGFECLCTNAPAPDASPNLKRLTSCLTAGPISIGLVAELEKNRLLAARMLDQLRSWHEVLAEIHDLASSASAGDSHYRLNLISIKAAVAARAAANSGAAVMSPKKCGRGTRSSAIHLNIGSTSPRKLHARLCSAADSAGDCLVGSGRLSRRAEPHARRRGHLSGAWEMRGLRRRLRLFGRQYSLLTEAQKMDCDWRAFLLLKMRREVSR